MKHNRISSLKITAVSDTTIPSQKKTIFLTHDMKNERSKYNCTHNQKTFHIVIFVKTDDVQEESPYTQGCPTLR
jgi:hypothetical protein